MITSELPASHHRGMTVALFTGRESNSSKNSYIFCCKMQTQELETRLLGGVFPQSSG